MKIEYRVVPTVRYTVARYEETDNTGSSSTRGEYDNEKTAHEVGYALCRAEHERLGFPLGDERIQYPKQIIEEDEANRVTEVLSRSFRLRMATELDRIHDALAAHLRANDLTPHPELEAAQQALCWALDPNGVASPYAMISRQAKRGPTFGEECAGLGKAAPPSVTPVDISKQPT